MVAHKVSDQWKVGSVRRITWVEGHKVSDQWKVGSVRRITWVEGHKVSDHLIAMQNRYRLYLPKLLKNADTHGKHCT